ncbi:hypothetical protein OVA14_09695 [Agrococcus sp. SL85]|uniref:hypothetical protein n=1 Tax=Agrococcus sp. SL85 TaxID=2995141 RepID=UPI00226C8DF8|nr:hypothetical protein [Agrococcus sp. SL85]WAC65609.1 hypothetical protein OVA14_09695 [Agrococcus sp. SL85]
MVPGDRAAAALRAVRDAAEAHDAGGAHGVLVTSMRMPDAPQLPEAVRGRTLLSIEALAADEAALAWLDGVRAAAEPERDEVGPTTQLAHALAATEPTEPSPSLGASVALARLDDATIDALLAWRDLPEQAGIVGVSLRLLGGALDAPPRPAFGSLAGARWLAMGLAPLLPGASREAAAASLGGSRPCWRPRRRRG